MNDPLKKYIEQHRDEFDHLEPSDEVFTKIKFELKSELPTSKSTVRLLPIKWLAVASVAIVLAATLLFLNKKNAEKEIELASSPVKGILEPKAKLSGSGKPQRIDIASVSQKPIHQKRKPHRNQASVGNLYADLADSTSSNKRLSAILKIQKSKVISYDVIDRLTTMLEHDANSNVRLAALNVLSKYADDLHVASNLVKSLSYQTDPLIQIGLMDLLKNTDSPALDGRLYALANDPSTYSAVKDQAYFILMNQNKL